MNRAIIFYATSDTYAVAVLVFVHLLHQLEANLDADVILLHRRVSRYLLDVARQMGIHPVRTDAVPHARGWYFRDCLVKLRVLQWTRHDVVLYVDADAIPLRSLSPLLHDPPPSEIAATRAYWKQQHVWCVALFVARPSRSMWERAAALFPEARRNGWYDEDVLNRAFEFAPLPETALYLDGEWEDVRRVSWFDNRTEGFMRASVVHFSAVGKPWSRSPQAIRAMRPHAHPLFHEMRERWWRAREEIFRNRPFAVRIRFIALKWWCQRVWMKKAFDFAAYLICAAFKSKCI